jgi:hypothetical protein
MIKRSIIAFFKLLDRLDRRKDTAVIVQRTRSVSEILEDGESILWEGAPSPSHAWSDHDQMEAANANPMRPQSLKFRAALMLVLAGFTLFMALWGVGFVYGGFEGLMEIGNVGGLFSALFCILFGLTLLSGLPFLLRPVANSRRARRLRYIITSRRSLLVRHGHGWPDIWVKSPVILCVSLLFLVSVLGFAIIFVQSSYEDVVDGAGAGTWFARLFILLFGAPVGLVFAAIGWVGLRFQTAIIRDAVKDRSAVFVRTIPFEDTARYKYPKLERLRSDGTGDVVLAIDHHWEFSQEFSSDPWFLSAKEIGFLSVPDANWVAGQVRKAMSKYKAAGLGRPLEKCCT